MLLLLLLIIILISLIIVLIIFVGHQKSDKYFGGVKNIIKPNIKLLNDPGTNGSFDKWKKSEGIKDSESFCLKYCKNNKTLYYIGANHTNDEHSDTFRIIKNVIESNKPDIVIVEGIPYNANINDYINGIGGEVKYAINIAKNIGISQIGIECDNKYIEKQILKKYSKKDLLGYHFMSHYKYCYKTNKDSKENMLKSFAKYYDPTFDGIKWFKKLYKKDFIYGKYLEYSAPYNVNNAQPTQLLSHDLNMIRSIGNIKNLYKIINDNDNIVYIMGMNHVYQEKDILGNTFGKYSVISNNYRSK